MYQMNTEGLSLPQRYPLPPWSSPPKVITAKGALRVLPENLSSALMSMYVHFHLYLQQEDCPSHTVQPLVFPLGN